MVKVEARISVCVFVDVDYLELFCLYCRMVILEPGIRCNNKDVLFANWSAFKTKYQINSHNRNDQNLILFMYCVCPPSLKYVNSLNCEKVKLFNWILNPIRYKLVINMWQNATSVPQFFVSLSLLFLLWISSFLCSLGKLWSDSVSCLLQVSKELAFTGELSIAHIAFSSLSRMWVRN